VGAAPADRNRHVRVFANPSRAAAPEGFFILPSPRGSDASYPASMPGRETRIPGPRSSSASVRSAGPAGGNGARANRAVHRWRGEPKGSLGGAPFLRAPRRLFIQFKFAGGEDLGYFDPWERRVSTPAGLRSVPWSWSREDQRDAGSGPPWRHGGLASSETESRCRLFPSDPNAGGEERRYFGTVRSKVRVLPRPDRGL
jgi:hypothetical protein